MTLEVEPVLLLQVQNHFAHGIAGIFIYNRYMRNFRVLFLLLLVFSLAACSSFNKGKISQDVLPWKPSGSILFQDDFSDEETGWEVVNNAYELKGYSNSGYMVSIKPANSRTVSTTNLIFSNSIMDAKVQKITGARESQFGLVCRYQDKLNYYAFVISADGYAGIVRLLDGSIELIGSEQFIRAEGISLDDGINDITASCIDDNLRLIVNGETIVSAQDSSFSNGQNGFLVETFEEGNLTAVFNDLIILKP